MPEDEEEVYSIVWGSSAKKEIRQIDKRYIIDILDVIDSLVDDQTPEDKDCIKLKGTSKNSPIQYRIRVGGYRIIYEVNNGTVVIKIIRVCKRNDAYKKK